MYDQNPKNAKHKVNFNINNTDKAQLMYQILYKPYDLCIQSLIKITKLLCDYVRITRPDIIQRYREGKCYKIANIEDIRRYGQQEMQYWHMDVDDYKSE